MTRRMRIEATSCADCPCKNNDNEYGDTCNLSKDEYRNVEAYAYNKVFHPDCPMTDTITQVDCPNEKKNQEEINE